SLKKALRADDLVGRIGGDEFVILLHNVLYDDVLKKRVELICKTLSIKISNDIFVMASLGVAVYPRDGTDFITLYRHSDLALYH
ncbi:MAG: diguanylate cyclase, partial [Clostridia bacterium]